MHFCLARVHPRDHSNIPHYAPVANYCMHGDMYSNYMYSYINASRRRGVAAQTHAGVQKSDCWVPNSGNSPHRTAIIKGSYPQVEGCINISYTRVALLLL